MSKKQKSIVLFSTGLGDSLQLLPLCKALKEEGHEVTGLFFSTCPSHELIIPLGILNKAIVLNNDIEFLLFALRNAWLFDYAFIEYSGSSLKNSLKACLFAKKVVTNRSKWYLRLLPNMTIRQPLDNAHLLQQNLHLALIGKQLSELKALYRLDGQLLPKSQNWTNNFGENYIVVQLCAANNSITYKNWPIEKWSILLKAISSRLPTTPLVLIGDKNEKSFGDTIMAGGINGVHSTIGKTSITELAQLIHHAKFYLGLDSGSMHLAAMLGTPTLTIWGPTDPQTLGYQVLDTETNLDIMANLSCHPCLSWIRHNTSEFEHPSLCPHQNCIKGISPETILKKFMAHWESLYGGIQAG